MKVLELSRSYQGVLFDMDGTLLDSRAVTTRIWTEWALANDIDPEAVHAVSHGRRAIDTIKDFATDQMDCDTEALKFERAELSDLAGITPVPGAIELLNALPRDRWAVVTSAGLDPAIRRLNAASIPIPDVLVSAENIKVGKPDPAGFRLAASKLDLNAVDCLVFEDAPAGIQAAKNAGADVVAIGFARPFEFDPGCPLIEDYHSQKSVFIDRMI